MCIYFLWGKNVLFYCYWHHTLSSAQARFDTVISRHIKIPSQWTYTLSVLKSCPPYLPWGSKWGHERFSFLTNPSKTPCLLLLVFIIAVKRGNICSHWSLCAYKCLYTQGLISSRLCNVLFQVIEEVGNHALNGRHLVAVLSKEYCIVCEQKWNIPLKM